MWTGGVSTWDECRHEGCDHGRAVTMGGVWEGCGHGRGEHMGGAWERVREGHGRG